MAAGVDQTQCGLAGCGRGFGCWRRLRMGAGLLTFVLGARFLLLLDEVANADVGVGPGHLDAIEAVEHGEHLAVVLGVLERREILVVDFQLQHEFREICLDARLVGFGLTDSGHVGLDEFVLFGVV